MKIAGIIAEYNPFHNGHAYHLAMTKKLLHADYRIVVMSGDFVQRGEPALLEKHLRAKMALECGADLVIELPVEYACASAEYFAKGAVTMLDRLGAVEFLSFGCETDDPQLFQTTAEILLTEPPEYRCLLQKFLRQGCAFPAARQQALLSYVHTHQEELPCCPETLDAFLKTPNNILGIEYCKALLAVKSSIQPVPILRTGSGYHDLTLDDRCSSASALRKHLSMGMDPALLEPQMPPEAFRLLCDAAEKKETLELKDLSLVLKYRLLCETPETLTQYQDVSPDLARRICNCLNAYESFPQFAELLKTRELTHTRIQRSLLHILLGIRSLPPIPYLRILGMRRDAAPLLTELKKHSTLPLLTKLPPERSDKPWPELFSLQTNLFASHLWQSAVSEKSSQPFIHERSKPAVILY